MSNQIIKNARPALKQVKNVLSADRDEARRRVLHLYKLWYRQAPYVGKIIERWFVEIEH
jgi:hypothetical protein